MEYLEIDIKLYQPGDTRRFYNLDAIYDNNLGGGAVYFQV